LSTVNSTAELLVILFPILDDLWVEEQAGYFEFNAILRSVIGALEAVLLRRAPRDMRALEQAIKAHLKAERLEREKQHALQAALVERQREAAVKHHHNKHHPRATNSRVTAPVVQLPVAEAVPSPAAVDAHTAAAATADQPQVEDAVSSSSIDATPYQSDPSTSAEVIIAAPGPDDATETVDSTPPPLPPKRNASLAAPSSKNATAISSLSFR
jgi:hypothetical protein